MSEAYRGRNMGEAVAKQRAATFLGMTSTSPAALAAATDTHCPYCSLQCGMRLSPGPDRAGAEGAEGAGLPVEVLERPDFPVNRGALCGKGRTAPALLARAARLTGPLLRDRPGGPLRSAS